MYQNTFLLHSQLTVVQHIQTKYKILQEARCEMLF